MLLEMCARNTVIATTDKPGCLRDLTDIYGQMTACSRAAQCQGWHEHRSSFVNTAILPMPHICRDGGGA